MATETPNLKLLKKDPVQDGNDTFNIKTMMNDNWDKIDTAVGQIPEQIQQLAAAGIGVKFPPQNATSTLDFTEKGIYYIADLASYSSLPPHPTGGTWVAGSASAVMNVYDVRPPYTTSSYLRVMELYVQMGALSFTMRRHLKITIDESGGVSYNAYAWDRYITANSASFTSAISTSSSITAASTITANGGLNAYANAEGLVLRGTDHVYAGFYPQGQAGGRQGYIGFASAGSKIFNINATDTLRLSDKNGGTTLGEITGLLYSGLVNSVVIELGYNRVDTGPSFIDFHARPGTDFDGRVIVDGDRNITITSYNRVYFQDQWRTMSADSIYNDIQSLKQSGVEYQQKLAAALNASGICSTGNVYRNK